MTHSRRYLRLKSILLYSFSTLVFLCFAIYFSPAQVFSEDRILILNNEFVFDDDGIEIERFSEYLYKINENNNTYSYGISYYSYEYEDISLHIRPLNETEFGGCGPDIASWPTVSEPRRSYERGRTCYGGTTSQLSMRGVCFSKRPQCRLFVIQRRLGLSYAIFIGDHMLDQWMPIVEDINKRLIPTQDLDQ